MEGFFNGSRELVEYLMEVATHAEEARQEQIRVEEDAAREFRDVGDVTHRWDVGKKMWVPMNFPTPPDPEMPDALEFFTLGGIVDYINANTEGLIPTDGTRYILQVVDQSSVELLTQPSVNERKRYIVATARAHVPGIEFGKYMDTDTFNTMLLSKFIETEPRKLLFSVVKSMTRQQSAQTTDDGVGQVVTVKDGVSMASNVTFQNPVPLRPRRTFTEVEQPESNFTLRVDGEAKVALFESDGEAWKNEAVNKIRDYLQANIENPAVIVIA